MMLSFDQLIDQFSYWVMIVVVIEHQTSKLNHRFWNCRIVDRNVVKHKEKMQKYSHSDEGFQ